MKKRDEVKNGMGLSRRPVRVRAKREEELKKRKTYDPKDVAKE